MSTRSFIERPLVKNCFAIKYGKGARTKMAWSRVATPNKTLTVSDSMFSEITIAPSNIERHQSSPVRGPSA